MYSTSSDTDVTQLTALPKAEVYIFRGRCVFDDVYKIDDKIVTSRATTLADINLRRTYRAIDSVATGRIPFLFCDGAMFVRNYQIKYRDKQQTQPYDYFSDRDAINIHIIEREKDGVLDGT